MLRNRAFLQELMDTPYLTVREIPLDETELLNLLVKFLFFAYLFFPSILRARRALFIPVQVFIFLLIVFSLRLYFARAKAWFLIRVIVRILALFNSLRVLLYFENKLPFRLFQLLFELWQSLHVVQIQIIILSFQYDLLYTLFLGFSMVLLSSSLDTSFQKASFVTIIQSLSPKSSLEVKRALQTISKRLIKAFSLLIYSRNGRFRVINKNVLSCARLISF